MTLRELPPSRFTAVLGTFSCNTVVALSFGWMQPHTPVNEIGIGAPQVRVRKRSVGRQIHSAVISSSLASPYRAFLRACKSESLAFSISSKARS